MPKMPKESNESIVTKNNRRPSCLFLLFILALPVGISIIAQRIMFTGIDAPPSDFGSGTMFDMIASRYDSINRVLAMGMDVGWRRRMVQEIKKNVEGLQNHRQPKILDLATGTADVALMLRQEIPQAQIVGIDPSNQMLQVGRTKVTQAGWDESVSLQQADAQNLLASLEPSFFDAATMAFGIRNVPNREKALCQINSVLKNHARFCILEFSEPDDSFGVLGILARYFIRYLVPVMGGILSGAPREYWHLQNSIKDFPTPQEFSRLVQGLQCSSSKDDEGIGSFTLEDLVQMNFGSVQLYVFRVEKQERSNED